MSNPPRINKPHIFYHQGLWWIAVSHDYKWSIKTASPVAKAADWVLRANSVLRAERLNSYLKQVTTYEV